MLDISYSQFILIMVVILYKVTTNIVILYKVTTNKVVENIELLLIK